MVSHKKTLGIKCIGHLDFATGKVYKTKARLLIAIAKRVIKAKAKSMFNLAFMRKLLIEGKIELLKRIKKYSWELSCKIASLKTQLRNLRKGYNTDLVLSFSERKKLFQ